MVRSATVFAFLAAALYAPILLLYGFSTTGSATVALLNNVEIFATFHEKISPRLWAGIVLSLEEGSKTGFSPGALLVIAA